MSKLGNHFVVDYNNAKSKEGAIITGDKFRITILSELLVRIEYSESNKFEDRPTEFALNRNFDIPKFRVKEDQKVLEITTEYFILEYQKGKNLIGPRFAPEVNFRIRLKDTDKVWYFNHPEARNYSAIPTSIDHTRVDIPFTNDKKTSSNNKVDKIKGLFSTDGFVSIDDSKSMIVDLDGTLIKEEKPNIDTYVFLYKRSFGLCLKDYFTLTGYPPLIPRYALGIWWNRNSFYSYDEIKTLMQTFRKHKIPLSILLLSENWHLKDKIDLSRHKTGFTFNPDLFHNPRNFSDFLHDRGVRLGLNIDPHEGIAPHEPKFTEISALLNNNTNTTIPFNVLDHGILNIYFNKLILPLYNNGVDLFWVDYFNPSDQQTMNALNYYHFNEFKRFNNLRGLLLARPSTIAPHRYPVHYSGETIVSWDTLKELPAYNSHSANLGLSWWSHDIGGYKDGIEDSELYIRYVQLGVFSPIFRFASKYGNYYKREPWRWDVKTLNIVREYTTLRHRLIPYLYGEAYKYAKTGLPLIQPLYYSYPEIYDEPIYKNEYLFGSELLVAPITEKLDKVMNRSVHRIFLPKGIWYDFTTGKKFVGDKKYIAFYKDEEFPVFAKSGSIIPLAKLSENINDTSSPETLEVHVFPGKSNIYDLYEDDGVTRLHEEGYSIITRFDYNYLTSNYTLIIRPVDGKSGIIPDTRNYIVRFRNTKAAETVTAYVNKDAYKVVTYLDGNDFIVEVVNVPTTKQLTINCKGKDIEIDAVRIINEEIDSIINDLQIKTSIKEEIAKIMYSDLTPDKKKIAIRKLKNKGLDSIFVRTFIRLIEFIAN